MDFVLPADHTVKSKEIKKRDKYQDDARELKTMDHDGNGNNNCK